MTTAKYKVIIADDEVMTRSRIIRLISAYPQFRVIAETEEGMQTLNAIRLGQPDVVFLDIKMPILNGFEIIERLPKDSYGKLVFITAYDEFAIRAFEAEALDYLLKPFDDSRFEKLIFRLMKQLGKEWEAELSRIRLKIKNEIVIVPMRDIQYIQSSNNYVEVVIRKHRYRIRETLISFSKKLDRSFYRIHRSYIINERRISQMKHIVHGDYVFIMENGKHINSSRSYRDTVRYLTNNSFTTS